MIVAGVALGGLTVAVASPSDPPALRHYTVQTGDTSWAVIVRKFCGTSTNAAATAFSLAATGLSSGSVRVGQIIHVDTAKCPPPATTSTTTTSTTTTVPATTTTVAATTTTGAPVDLSAFVTGGNPIPGPGQGEAAFRALCEASHYAYNDPIVYPGQPGASHLHLFFGNTGTNETSTYASLRADGSGTCQGGPINRSAYWMPAVITPAGKVAVPDVLIVYYKANGTLAQVANVAPLPLGLKMIAGYNMAAPGGDTHYYWNCDGQPADVAQQAIPNCAAGTTLSVRLGFPACWDGVNLDSPDHRSHMAYRVGTVCPPSHPVLIPEYSMLALWTSDGDTANWKLSSDTMPGMTHVNGSTFHGDWIGAWEPAYSDIWLNSCLRQYRNCNGGELGDGQVLAREPAWPGGAFIDMPARG